MSEYASVAGNWSRRAYLILVPTLATIMSIPRWRGKLGFDWVRNAGRLTARLKALPADPGAKRWLVTIVDEAAAQRPAGSRRDDAVDQLLALAFVAAGGLPKGRSRDGSGIGDELGDYLDTLEGYSQDLSGQGDSQGTLSRKAYVAAYAPLVDAILRAIDLQRPLR